MIETDSTIQQIEVLIQQLPGQDDLPLPSYQSEDAAGMDVCAGCPENEPVEIDPGRIALVPCGFAMALPTGYEAQIRPRSGLAAKHGISIPNAPGTIDADYRGQVKVALINHGHETFTVTRGMRIAQMVVKPVPRTKWVLVEHLPDTVRGAGGFGHTGH